MTGQPIEDAELDQLFTGFACRKRVGLAVSGGPDSTALMHLALRWRKLRDTAYPRFTVLTVDHGLRSA